MSFRTSTISLGLLTGALFCAPAGKAGGMPALSGIVVGEVRNSTGVTQMGATVFLYNRYDQLVRQVLTNETGKFGFDGLAPDLYSIRVILASFVPAVRKNIAVEAGSQNLLRINLASVLSTVELVPASASQGALMSDDWKWVLRSSQSTRPVLRLLPVTNSSKRHSATDRFSGTTGVVRVSAGDGDTIAGTTAQDLGTAFALATVYKGSARVRVSGNFGYMANTGLPTAGFRTTYSHDKDGLSGPQVSLTVHQVYFPGLAGSASPGSDQPGNASGPALRTASFAASDKIDLSDQLQLEYGAHLDSVAFLHRLTYMSPYARATYNWGKNGSLRLAVRSGTEPNDLVMRDGEAQGPDLNRDLTLLSTLPLVSRSGGRIRLQRDQTFEAGYQLVRGSRKYSVGVYSESVSDSAFTMSAPDGFLSRSDLLPDLDSRNFLFDAGDYSRTGYTAAVTQSIGENVDFTLAAGRGGALIADSREAPAETAADVRALIHKAQRSWVTARASATVPGSGTHIVTSYGWTDFRSLMPAHLSLTGETNQDEGWNVAIRQPLPRFSGMRGRLEATAEMRNALAQGYLPLNAGGRTALLTNSPRALRGGLNFLF